MTEDQKLKLRETVQKVKAIADIGGDDAILVELIESLVVPESMEETLVPSSPDLDPAVLTQMINDIKFFKEGYTSCRNRMMKRFGEVKECLK